MPTWITINGANEWEAATSLAAAYMRQNIEIFDRLSDYHDSAMKCLPNTGIYYIDTIDTTINTNTYTYTIRICIHSKRTNS
jgi:hypothetical protein